MDRKVIRERLEKLHERMENNEVRFEEYIPYNTGERYEIDKKDSDYDSAMGQYKDIMAEYDRERL